ncbi:MAG: beta-ketoacyl-[acyl-carrier-protein] synthase family protein, partial [Polaromonas sp.]|nr:beta-ketoacyl-[acyl-carrier-protein] synthase family protein [Polaromonas sp.]
MRRVAITGLGVVSAVGIGQIAFFDALLSARSGLLAVEVPFPTGPDHVVVGPVSIDLDSADPATHIPRARLITMDRVSQLALVAGREAMAQAGLAAETGTLARERFGVFMGTGSGGAGSIDSAYTSLLEHRAPRLRPMTVVLSMSNATAAHLSLEFDLHGPSNTFSNACASSAIAIGEAFRQIRHGYADVMLAGG